MKKEKKIKFSLHISFRPRFSALFLLFLLLLFISSEEALIISCQELCIPTEFSANMNELYKKATEAKKGTPSKNLRGKFSET